jgi:two-component system alkaline phosphatase synthesis response regulator PhoP
MNQTITIRGRALGGYPPPSQPIFPYEPSPLAVFGHVTVNRSRRQVFVKGETVHLTDMEYRLLEVFLDNPDQVLSRERLFFLVRGYTVMGDTRTVDVHVKQLRKKLWGLSHVFQNQ